MTRPPEGPSLNAQVARQMRLRGEHCRAFGFGAVAMPPRDDAHLMPPAANEPQLDPFELTQL